MAGTAQDGTALAKIYRNDHGAFVDANVGLIPSVGDKAAWADFDNDGWLDVILGGRIFRNEGSAFVELAAALGAEGPFFPACADYDNDGRMDFAVVVSSFSPSWDVQSTSVKVYRNLLQTPPVQIPPPPTSLTATVVSNSVRLTWLTPEGGPATTNGLTYNVRLVAMPGSREIVPAISDPVTGQRRLPRIGNAQCRLFSTFTNLPVGFYQWSVQSVNGSYVGSPWSPEQSFVISNGAPVFGTLVASNVLCCSARLNGLVTPGALETRAWFEWGPTTDFGNVTTIHELPAGLLPVLVTDPLSDLPPLTGFYFRLVASNSSGLLPGATRSFVTEVPAPTTAATLRLTNVTCTAATVLGSLPAGIAPAEYFVEWGPTPGYGNLASVDFLNAALRFDGSNDCVLTGERRFSDIVNNFTIELWAYPAAHRAETAASVSGTAGTGGQRYALFPEYFQGDYILDLHAGVGVSIGTNGLSVLEHSAGYLPAVLVHSNQLSGWVHVAVSYSNALPRLFLNGLFIRSGLVSGRKAHPGANIGGILGSGWTAYGPYAGALREVRVWDAPLDATTIQAWMNRRVTAQHPAFARLQGYWPMNEGRGTNVSDLGPRGYAGQLVNGPTWTGGWPGDTIIFSARLAGLTPDTTYHFRSVSTNPGGTVYGADQTFVTMPRPTLLGVFPQNSPAAAGVQLQFNGSPDAAYALEVSTNLIHWLAVTNLTAGPDGRFEFFDTTATNFPTRFYRLRAP